MFNLIQDAFYFLVEPKELAKLKIKNSTNCQSNLNYVDRASNRTAKS